GSRLDGATAAVERRRGLLLRELEQVAAREDEPVALGQGVQRRDQGLVPLRAEERRLGGRGRVPRGRARRAERELLPPAGRAPPVPRLVRDDPQQPRPERRAAPEAAERAVRLDEPVLRGLLGVGGVAGEQVGGAEGDPLVQAHELLVGGCVAALRALDELLL